MEKPCKTSPHSNTSNNTQTSTETLQRKSWEQLFAEHYSNHSNATRAYLFAKPHVTLNTARKEGNLAIKKPHIIKLVNEKINKQVDKKRYSKEQILDNIDVIREKTLKKQEFGTSLKCNKEIAELQGLYDRGSDGPGQYMTLIEKLTINQTTISSGEGPKQVEHEVEAEYEDVNNDD